MPGHRVRGSLLVDDRHLLRPADLPGGDHRQAINTGGRHRDVPVVLQLEFQQSKLYENMEAPQFQFNAGHSCCMKNPLRSAWFDSEYMHCDSSATNFGRIPRFST